MTFFYASPIRLLGEYDSAATLSPSSIRASRSDYVLGAVIELLYTTTLPLRLRAYASRFFYVTPTKSHVSPVKHAIDSSRQSITPMKHAVDSGRQSITPVKHAVDSSRQGITSVMDAVDSGRQGITSVMDAVDYSKQSIASVMVLGDIKPNKF